MGDPNQVFVPRPFQNNLSGRPDPTDLQVEGELITNLDPELALGSPVNKSDLEQLQAASDPEGFTTAIPPQREATPGELFGQQFLKPAQQQDPERQMRLNLGFINRLEASQEREIRDELLPWHANLRNALADFSFATRDIDLAPDADAALSRLMEMDDATRQKIANISSVEDLYEMFPERAITLKNPKPPLAELWITAAFLAERPDITKVSGLSVGVPEETTDNKDLFDRLAAAGKEFKEAEAQLRSIAEQQFDQMIPDIGPVEAAIGTANTSFALFLASNPLTLAGMTIFNLATSYVHAVQSGVSSTDPDLQDEERQLREMLHAWNPQVFGDPNTPIAQILNSRAFKTIIAPLAGGDSSTGGIRPILDERSIQRLQEEIGNRDLAEKSYAGSVQSYVNLGVGTLLDMAVLVGIHKGAGVLKRGLAFRRAAAQGGNAGTRSARPPTASGEELVRARAAGTAQSELHAEMAIAAQRAKSAGRKFTIAAQQAIRKKIEAGGTLRFESDAINGISWRVTGKEL